VRELHRRFADELARAPVPPHAFGDAAELVAWLENRDRESFRRNVARGLYVRLGGREIGKLPTAPQAPVPLRRTVLGWVPQIAAGVLVWRIAGWLATPAKRRKSSIDEFCGRLLQRGPHREARAWLAEDRPGDHRFIGPRPAEESRRFVDELYRLGARDVQALQMVPQPDGQVTHALVVRLPDVPAQRRALLAMETMSGLGALPDEGQHYMLLNAAVASPGPDSSSTAHR
jgi:hypothetical protein